MPKRIDSMRKIVEEHQHAEIEGTLVDATSANAYVSVWDALNLKNRASLDSRNIYQAMDVVWKVINR